MKTSEELIWEIHDAVTEIRAELSARTAICDNVHSVVDSRLDGLHKKIVGNGQPGLEQNLTSLATRFDKLETKVVIWASIALVVGQIIAPKVLKMMGLM